MPPDVAQLDAAIADLALGRVVGITELSGGTTAVYRVDLSSGAALVLKIFAKGNESAPAREAYAALQLEAHGLPVPQYLLVDTSRTRLPFALVILSHLPGVPAGSLQDHPDIASLQRQTGALLRRLHEVRMPAYGRFGAHGLIDPVSDNTAFIRHRIEHVFEQFVAMGGEASLAARLSDIVEDRFDAIVPNSNGPVFAHDDVHPNNILALEDDSGRLTLSGLLDFGNAQAADAVYDLAKCLFCTEHDASGSTPHILAGYGKIDHPEPEAAIWFYALLHRMGIWGWLRHIGAIPGPQTGHGLMDALQEMANA